MRYLIERHLAKKRQQERELETAEVVEVSYGTLVDLFARGGMVEADARLQATLTLKLESVVKIGNTFYRCRK